MRNWTHKVVKMSHSIKGKLFQYPTVATFGSLEEAMEDARDEAEKLHATGITGVCFAVRTRKAFTGLCGKAHTVAEFRVLRDGVREVRFA